MIKPPSNICLNKIASSRALFINGQVVKGNLKPKRPRRKTEIFRRLQVRVEVNRLIAEQPTKDDKE